MILVASNLYSLMNQTLFHGVANAYISIDIHIQNHDHFIDA